MAITYAQMTTAADRGAYQSTAGIVSLTDKRDVSDILDLFALTDTPFINDIGWGPESGANSIEWISENLGEGYLVVGSAAASTAVSVDIACTDLLATMEAAKMITAGSIFYHFSSTDSDHAIMQVESIDVNGTITFECLSVGGGAITADTSMAAGDKMWILGAVANEGSLPRAGQPRDRVVNSNNMMILRQDVQTTGSMKSTDMYAIGKEDQHQILMRLKEMQREREKITLYSATQARSSTVAGLMSGAFGFLIAQSGSHIDTSTRTLTETAVNAVVGACWENGSTNLTFYANKDQCAKFTQWDKNRIRMAPRDGRGGGHITKYMTEVGVEVGIQPMRQVPKNIAFVIDPSKCQLRAKKGRKAIMEKLGKMGDFEDWQIISEFTFEMKGYNLGQHGLFTAL